MKRAAAAATRLSPLLFSLLTVVLLGSAASVPRCEAFGGLSPPPGGDGLRLRVREASKVSLNRVTRLKGGATSDSGSDFGAQDPASSVGQASSSSTVFNLIKTISGSGMLSLPAGLAAYSSHPSAVVPAAFLIAALGAVCAHTFYSVGETCKTTGAKTYEQAWAKSVNKKSAWIPAAACVATCFAGCLSFTLVASDSIQSLMPTLGITGGAFANRSLLIGAISLFVFLPLSLMKSLEILGFTSMLGTVGLLYTASAMGFRYFDGSYGPGGKFAASLAADYAPKFSQTAEGNPVLALVLISMLGAAFEAHFNAPLFYRSLRNNTLPRFKKVVGWGFSVAAGLMIAVTSFGFLTFGGASQGFILSNYAPGDAVITIARALICLSILFSYPLCFVGLRDGTLELLGDANPSTEKRTAWTVGLLSLTSLISLVITDLGFVNSFSGALTSNLIIYIFPAIMSVMPLLKNRGGGALANRRLGIGSNMGILVLGVLMGLLGATVSVLQTYFPDVLRA